MGKKRNIKKGLPPGSIVFTGEQQTNKANMRLVRYNESHYDTKDIAIFPIANFVKADPNFVVWYDLKGVHDVSIVEQLGAAFMIHTLVMEDIVNICQRPKFEEYTTGNYIVLQSFKFNKTTLRFQTEQVSIFFGKDFLVSFQEDAEELFANVNYHLAEAKGKIRQKKADYLAYSLLDMIVDDYIEVLETIEDITSELEIAITHEPKPTLKSAIYQLKRELLTFRKSVNSLREAILKLNRTETNFVTSEGMNFYYRDLLDHITHVLERTENYRDMLSELQNLYLAEISYKSNGVIQVLTIVSSIFIPLTFIVGVYGMNFEYMPELHWEYGYYTVWGVMIIIAISLLLYFHRKRWI
jgi:magnesium transporter